MISPAKLAASGDNPSVWPPKRRQHPQRAHLPHPSLRQPPRMDGTIRPDRSRLRRQPRSHRGLPDGQRNQKPDTAASWHPRLRASEAARRLDVPHQARFNRRNLILRRRSNFPGICLVAMLSSVRSHPNSRDMGRPGNDRTRPGSGSSGAAYAPVDYRHHQPCMAPVSDHANR